MMRGQKLVGVRRALATIIAESLQIRDAAAAVQASVAAIQEPEEKKRELPPISTPVSELLTRALFRRRI
ncbi:MAG: hypothetical protein HC767_09980, partial [Akkermansiaceae bacterium]|nr:hypothetical protein [Akkermansiaceae bacterium]